MQVTDLLIIYFKVAAQIIENAGDATDPNYAEKLISTIEKNNLTIYDVVPYPGKLIKKGSKNKFVGMVHRKLYILRNLIIYFFQ